MQLVHANSSGLITLQGYNAVSPVENGDKTTQKKRVTFLQLSDSVVVSPGIEPGTQGFSVLCSTN